MSTLVDRTEIEKIVGVIRHESLHLARAVSAEETVYVLHSENCLATTADLRVCPFSTALDFGIDPELWANELDKPVIVFLVDRQLVPIGSGS